MRLTMRDKHRDTKQYTGVDHRFSPALTYRLVAKRIKHVYFRFKGDVLQITHPHRMKETQVLELLMTRVEAINKLRLMEYSRPNHSLTDSEWLLLGTPYQLTSGPRFTISGSLITYASKMTLTTVQGRLYEHLVMPLINEYILTCWPLIDAHRAAPRIRHRAMVRLYGAYYPSQHEIQFNTRLIYRTPEEIRYTVVHELMHAKIGNHSSQFYAAIEAILPDYRRHHDQLKHTFVADTHSKRG